MSIIYHKTFEPKRRQKKQNQKNFATDHKEQREQVNSPLQIPVPGLLSAGSAVMCKMDTRPPCETQSLEEEVRKTQCNNNNNNDNNVINII